jgi:hypothetical protein
VFSDGCPALQGIPPDDHAHLLELRRRTIEEGLP